MSGSVFSGTNLPTVSAQPTYPSTDTADYRVFGFTLFINGATAMQVLNSSSVQTAILQSVATALSLPVGNIAITGGSRRLSQRLSGRALAIVVAHIHMNAITPPAQSYAVYTTLNTASGGVVWLGPTPAVAEALAAETGQPASAFSTSLAPGVTVSNLDGQVEPAPTPPPTSSPSKLGLYVGIPVGVVCGICLISLLVWSCIKKREKKYSSGRNLTVLSSGGGLVQGREREDGRQSSVVSPLHSAQRSNRNLSTQGSFRGGFSPNPVRV